MVAGLKLTDVSPVFYGRKPKQPGLNSFVRVIQLEIELSTLADYTAALVKILRKSINSEPGALLMYSIQEKSEPTRFSILEVYENETAAKQHLDTPSYKDYKNTTRDMIKSRQVIDASSVYLGVKN